jgi:serine/threonine protein kinase
MDLIGTYNSLPSILKKQIKTIQPKFDSSRKVINYSNHMFEQSKLNKSERNKKIISRLAIFTLITSNDLLTPDYFQIILCYNDSDHNDTIKLISILKEGKHAKVFEAKDKSGETKVVKYYNSEKRDTCFEIGVYDKLKEMGMKLPWFNSNFYFWNSKILVLEKLTKLNSKEDEFDLAIQLIKQLKILHSFGVHSDIKPDNIMKKRNYKTKKTTYYLIDFGGISYEKFQHGYRRWIWSPKWTCQTSHQKNQVTTMKHDFIELGYTMKHIQTLKKYKDKKSQKKVPMRSGFDGKLGKYMDYINEIDEKKIPEDIHDQLIKFIEKLIK